MGSGGAGERAGCLSAGGSRPVDLDLDLREFELRGPKRGGGGGGPVERGGGLGPSGHRTRVGQLTGGCCGGAGRSRPVGLSLDGGESGVQDTGQLIRVSSSGGG